MGDIPYEPSDTSEPHIIKTFEINDLIRDLHLTENHSELQASGLKGWNLLNADGKVTFFLKRSVNLSCL